MRGLKRLVPINKLNAPAYFPALTVPAMRGLKPATYCSVESVLTEPARTHRPRDEGTETSSWLVRRFKRPTHTRTHRPRDEGTETFRRRPLLLNAHPRTHRPRDEGTETPRRRARRNPGVSTRTHRPRDEGTETTTSRCAPSAVK